MGRIFVFGSNLSGFHGASLRFARRNHGAIYGQGVGLHGTSYGLPTKNEVIDTLPLSRIKVYVDEFIAFSIAHPELEFDISRVGCGYAGYNWERDIRPLFPETLPTNCRFMEPL